MTLISAKAAMIARYAVPSTLNFKLSTLNYKNNEGDLSGHPHCF